MATNKKAKPANDYPAATAPKATRTNTDDALLNGESFPIEALPPIARRLAEEIAHAFQIPVGLPAASILGIGSCAIGKGLVTRAYLDADTPANLYIVLGGSVGAGKGAAFKPIVEPLKQVQGQAQILSRTFATANPEQPAEAEFVGAPATTPVPPRQLPEASLSVETVAHRVFKRWTPLKRTTSDVPILYSEDMTAPALAHMLVENGECLGSISADALDLVGQLSATSLDRQGAKLGILLKGYSEDPIGVGRVAKKIHLNSPNLSVMWLTQLNKLDQFAANRALVDSGLVSRCLLGRFEVQPQKTQGALRRLDSKVIAGWNRLALGLLDEYRLSERRRQVTCSEAARQRLSAFHDEMVDRRKGDLIDLEAHVVRVPENAVRLALVLHCLKHGPASHQHELSKETANHAIRLSRWFLSQRLDLLVVTREEQQELEAKHVLDKLHAGPPQGYPVRWFQQRRLAPTKAGVEAILQRMVTQGSIESITTKPARGGHEFTHYRLPLRTVQEVTPVSEAEALTVTE